MKIFQTYLPVQAAIEEMDKAIELDPEFAAAYAARAWQRGVLVTVFPGKSLRADNLGSNKALAQADAERALELDPKQGRAIAAMVMLALTELRFADAVNLAERAYQMNPNDTWPVLTYSVMRRFQGRTEETMRLHARLTALDPGRPTVQGDAVSAAWWLGEYETALIHARRALAIGPDLWFGHLKLAMALSPLGRHEEAVKHADQAIAIMGDSINVKSLAVLIDVYHKAGAPEKVAAIIAQVEDLSAQSYTLPCLRFCVYLGAGDGENAMKWLTIAHEREEYSLYCITLKGLKDHPIFDPIRDHPRFEEFVNKGQDLPGV
jgi:tetratricopeptide (TPR) repeat protein